MPSKSNFEEVLRAVHGGEIDALLVDGEGGQHLFALHGADHAYRVLVEEMAEGALTLQPDGVVVYANLHFAALLGQPLETVIGSSVLRAFASQDRARLSSLLIKSLNGPCSAELELLKTQSDQLAAGTSGPLPESVEVLVPVLVAVSPLKVNGLTEAVCMIVTDLTTQKRGEAAIQARENLLNLLEAQRRTEEMLRDSLATLRLHDNALGAISQSVLITDASLRISYVNNMFEVMTGFTEAEVIGTTCKFMQGIDTSAQTLTHLNQALRDKKPFQGEILNYRKDGTSFWNELSITPVFDARGALTQYVGVQRDVTAQKEAQKRISTLAHYDTLTGLPNRTLLQERATYALKLAQRSGESLALMFLDLDHFKNINDSLGHGVGDQLLVEVSARLQLCLRDQDVLARMGGDEFVLILPGTNGEGAIRVAHKLLHAMETSVPLGSHEISITLSIGAALYPADGDDFDTLAKCADTAMYRAKRSGRNTVQFYTPELQALTVRTIELENGLRRALELNQFQVYYQPQISLTNGTIIGVEALLRWSHPVLGSVSPAEFIPVAESSGLIISIGTWVMKTAVSQLRAWLDAGLPAMTMAVNLSAVQFRRPELPDLIRDILNAAGLPPHLLELELTESVALDDPLGAIETMNTLHSIGVKMSIDDFGTGYSSLSYLKRFKVNKLKIDQSFVRNLIDDAEDQVIVGVIIGLAKSLGLQVIAEGVETAQQMEYLRQHGCHDLQGYWFSRPLPVDQLVALVRSQA